ncbi:hypothetical protein Tco_1167180 [Tanacetum coccineum]
MEADINNMTLNEYLMYERNRNLARSYPSRKSVSPMRNRIYPDSDEEDEEYCSLTPLLPRFQTPQPCATLNLVHHNNHSEVDIESMTLEEYARYELTMSTMKNEIQVPTQGAENIRKMEHEVPNRCDNITNYEDSDQEDGGLPGLPNFSATNEFASVCEHGKDSIDVNTAQDLEEVQVEDVEMDEDEDIDHSNTKEEIQWSHAHDPFLVVLEPDVQSSFLLRTIPSSISNEVKREFKNPYSDDEESNHEDASGQLVLHLKQHQHYKLIPQTTAISNHQTINSEKEDVYIWAMEMEHYLEYIDNEVWKVIQNGNSKKRISTGKDGIVRVLSPVTVAKIQAVEKERKAKNILPDGSFP